MTVMNPELHIGSDAAASGPANPKAKKSTPSKSANSSNKQRRNRIALVRRQQGISLRTAARQMGQHVSVLREQEEETADLTLSQLYRWQAVLDVPVSDLLVEAEGPLSHPIMHRAQMVRLMKTAASIRDSAPSGPVHRMAENLINQLIEAMPELREISAWHTVGQRRSQDELGVAYDRRLADDSMGGSWED